MTVKTASEQLASRTRWAITAMALAALMAVLNGTTVTASLEAMAPALGTSISGVIWVMTVYLIAAAASVPLIGWLTARIGSARVLQLALVGFALGSLLSGFAWDLPSMIVFRVIQGVSGGMLEPAAMAIIGVITPTSLMGRVMGLVSLVINLGPVIGPLIGGVLVSGGAWQWIFWMNVPLAVLVSFAAWRLLPRQEQQSAGSAPVDVVGLVLLPPGFVLVLLGLNRWGAGASPLLVGGLVLAGLVLLAIYVPHALRTTEPLVDIRLLRIPSFAAALGIMSAVGLVMYTQLTVLPILAQRSFGLAPVWQALPVAVLGIGLLISMTLAGRLSDSIGPRVLVRGGAAVTAVTALLIAIGHDHWPIAVVLALVALLGLGFGALAAPTFASLYRVLPKASIARGTAALFIMVQLFASAGVTLVGFLTEASANPASSAYFVIAGVAAVVTGVASLMPTAPERPAVAA
ncbi:MAG: DHA2 family efflux MFS transporter permease subunit [Microbacterium sp.]|jgi:EmrB/QacA subfamily drug resistance transporter|nr:DHA2 family efflux MFS transporter permease subunit [Microbacterium sp.]